MKNLLIITQKVDENDQLLGFFIEWIARFAKKFGKVTVICLEKGAFKLPENVRVVDLGKNAGSNKLKQLYNFYSQVYILRKDYDAVFVHMNPIWMVLGGICWKIMGKKRILWYTHKSVTTKLRLAEKLSDVILTASLESFRLKSNKVTVTGHGIDIDLFKPNPELKKGSGPLRILSVGRLASVKNYDTLVDAAKVLKNNNFEFKATMVGEPALEEDKAYALTIKTKIKEKGLEEYFDFVGKVNYKNLPPYYQSHDIFVHLSKTGSLDKTLLEAMACGMNVLSSNDAAKAFLPAELIFKSDDSAGLAQKIEIISKKNYGQDLRKYVVENNNLDKLIDKIAGLINK